MSTRHDRPDRRELRTFGLSLAVVALLWVAVLAWRGHPGAAPWLIGASAVLGLLAWLAPGGLRPIHYVWMPVARGIAWGLTWVLLTAVFLIVFLPVGALRRAAGKDPLLRGRLAPGQSGWIARPPGESDRARAAKQY